jgi:hypothetical protein
VDAELASLTPPEREVLAVLAVLGDVALSLEQLEALTSVADPRPVLAGLEQRGFVEREDGRYRIAQGRRERLREAWNVVDTGDRVLRQLISIAEDGRLTWSDLDAVLGVSRWACEFGRFEELLRLVKAVQTTVDVVRRIEAWIVIVRRAQQAARALGDVDAQAWAEQELAKYAHVEAHESERAGRSLARRRAPRWLAPAVAAAAAAGAGLLAGYAIFNTSSSPGLGATTVRVPPSTVILGGSTTTVLGTTVTVPGAVTTVTVTTTVTTSPQIP